jgi:hypothetical protein
MYQGGLVARQEADQRAAAQEASAAAPAAEVPASGEGAPPGAPVPRPKLPSFYSEDTPASANEMWQRLHSDPLFAIKQQVGPAPALPFDGARAAPALPSSTRAALELLSLRGQA